MNQATRFGKPLPDGGTIGIAAAASPYDSRSDVLRGIEWWESHGYLHRAGAPGRIRVCAGDSVPRLRSDCREPEAARRLLGHHGFAHRTAPEGGSRDDLRER